MKPTKFTEQYIFGKVLDFSMLIRLRDRFCFLSFVEFFRNLTSQISNGFDIVLVIFKANFYKKLNGQSKFCFSATQICAILKWLVKVFLAQDDLINNCEIAQNWVLSNKICFCHSIPFLVLL